MKWGRMAKVRKIKDTMDRVIGFNAGTADEVRMKLIDLNLQTGSYVDDVELAWLEKQAIGGNEQAQQLYFSAVMTGQVKDADWLRLEQWSLALLETAPPLGLLQLGSLYMTEESGLMDIRKAEKYYRMGVEMGVPGFSTALGMLYWREYSSENAESHELSEIRKLLEAGLKERATSEVYYVLAEVCQEMGDDVAAVKAMKKVLKLDPKDGEVCMALGSAYLEGIGCRQDDKLALQYFQKAANAGVADGMYQVGRAYMDGCGTRRNAKRAVDYFRRAADAGFTAAWTSLGSCYAEGNGVPLDVSKAYECFKKAYEAGEVLGTLMLSKCYEYGMGVEMDENRAQELMTEMRTSSAFAEMEGFGEFLDAMESEINTYVDAMEEEEDTK